MSDDIIVKCLHSSICDFQDLRGKSILLTGATGLIGSTFVDFLMTLNRSYDFAVSVYALGRDKNVIEKRFSRYLSDTKFCAIQSDVCQLERLEPHIDFIIHGAGLAHPLAFSRIPADVAGINLLGTINMLELARKKDAKLVFLSSGEVYGINDASDCGIKEKEYGYIDILNPRSCYPESKRAAETLCACYFAQYKTQSVIARLCHTYGAAITDTNSRADSQFLRNVLNGQDIVMKSAGAQRRSYCYVNDTVLALLYILLKGTVGEAYNIADKNSVVTIREYAQILADVAGVQLRSETPEEIEKKGYSVVSKAVLDASKLEQLGWKTQYTIYTGLKETYDRARKELCAL